MKLTDRQIQLTKPPVSGRLTLSDGNGLQLRITSSDKRSWSLQYRYQEAMRKYTIGSYPEVSLKNARARNTELRVSIQAGDDPQTAKKRARSPSSTNVEECFEEYLRDHLKVNLKSWPEYERAMRRDGLPFVGKIELEALDKPAISGFYQTYNRAWLYVSCQSRPSIYFQNAEMGSWCWLHHDKPRSRYT